MTIDLSRLARECAEKVIDLPMPSHYGDERRERVIEIILATLTDVTREMDATITTLQGLLKETDADRVKVYKDLTAATAERDKENERLKANSPEIADRVAKKMDGHFLLDAASCLSINDVVQLLNENRRINTTLAATTARLAEAVKERDALYQEVFDDNGELRIATEPK